MQKEGLTIIFEDRILDSFLISPLKTNFDVYDLVSQQKNIDFNLRKTSIKKAQFLPCNSISRQMNTRKMYKRNECKHGISENRIMQPSTQPSSCEYTSL